MCGIVGIVAKHNGFWKEHEDTFEQMLFADGVRGMDSTGAFVVMANNQIKIAKQAANPGVFLMTESYKGLKKTMYEKGIMVVGHNRKATVGEVISQNAHPFAKEHIVLVHNGYIANAKFLDEKITVDSEAIVSMLLKEKDPVEAIKSLFGAYAIVWYNQKTRKLYLTRNKERPLAVAFSDQHMMFASEKSMLNWMIERNNLTQYKAAYDLQTDVLYEVSRNPFLMKEVKVPEAAAVVVRSNIREYPEGDQSCLPHVDLRNDPSFANDVFDEDHHRTKRDEGVDPLSRLHGDLLAGKEDVQDVYESKAKQLRLLYPYNSQVLFTPTTIIKDGKGAFAYTVVKGTVWVPGKVAAKATVSIPEKKDDECYIDPITPLMGVIQSQARRNQDIYFILDRIWKPKSTSVSINGTEIGDEEWTMICNKLSCDECAVAPNRAKMALTEVYRRPEGNYEITCHECYDKIITGKPTINK